MLFLSIPLFVGQLKIRIFQLEASKYDVYNEKSRFNERSLLETFEILGVSNFHTERNCKGCLNQL